MKCNYFLIFLRENVAGFTSSCNYLAQLYVCIKRFSTVMMGTDTGYPFFFFNHKQYLICRQLEDHSVGIGVLPYYWIKKTEGLGYLLEDRILWNPIQQWQPGAFSSKYILYRRLPLWLGGRESTCNAGATGDTGSIPGSGRSPGGGNGNPLRYSCLENPMDRGAWWATVHRVAKSQRRLKWLSTHEHVCSIPFVLKVWLSRLQHQHQLSPGNMFKT